MLKYFVNQIVFPSRNIDTYSQKHTNCNFGCWHKLQVELKSANERMTFHEEIKKDNQKKALLENVKIAAKN